jgi:signal transduction histidine kinase
MFPRFLRRLPQSSYKVRLSIFLLSFFFCGFFMILGMIVTYNRGLTPIFAIPVALAAWMFRPREAAIAIGSIFLMLVIINSHAMGGHMWPFPLILTFLCGLFAALIVAFAIGFLRHALHIADAAQRQSQLAEQRIALGFEREQRLNALKDQFLANVSHELRTPLTEVRGYIELLQDHHEELDDALQKDFLYKALHGCDELQSLMSDILDAVRISNDVHPPHFEEVLLANLVRETLARTSAWIQEQRPLHLDIPPALTVWADRQQLRQVLRNLLSNAYKYSPPWTPITVRASTSKAGGEAGGNSSYVHVSVQDSGAGIKPAEISRLFQKFARLERDVAGPTRGTGLGLYISKQLVEGMGGSIWVESAGTPGQGCCFCFTVLQTADAGITGGRSRQKT